ncbi:HtaA domain-containing protein [Streptomyces albireticuli]|uniref:HtaA domain-containing protein n=1 Tax=Streptomyces albireticuli TaxID=1940 RepID=UPI0036BE712B
MLPSRPARVPVVALLATLLAALAPAAGAGAAERAEVSGGRLDWGIKSSFQSYVTGPIAKGSWELRGGAATVGDNRFRFHSAKGSYDPGGGSFDAAFSGGVHFTGHRKDDGTHELDLTLGNPAVRISGGEGTLYADVTSRARGSGEVTTADRVPFASLDLSGVDLRSGGTAVTLTNLPATLTEQGAKAFAGFYTAGTALDPVGLSADVAAAAAKPSSSPGDSPSGDSSSREPGKKGEFTGAAVDWGVRRTFREYVTGPIAQGSWKLADGAQDGGALFRFPRGKGTYDEGAGSLDAAFEGTLRFTGKHLDLTLAGLRAEVKDGEGTLSADVTGAGAHSGKNVPLVTFDASGLKEKDGLAAVTEAPAKLTARGAEAFGRMYQEGAEMDPVSLAVPLDGRAKLPPLPDLGSGPKPSPSSAAPARAEASSSSSSSSDFPVLPVSLAGAAAAALAAAAFVVVRRRRRASADSTAPGADG